MPILVDCINPRTVSKNVVAVCQQQRSGGNEEGLKIAHLAMIITAGGLRTVPCDVSIAQQADCRSQQVIWDARVFKLASYSTGSCQGGLLIRGVGAVPSRTADCVSACLGHHHHALLWRGRSD